MSTKSLLTLVLGICVLSSIFTIAYAEIFVRKSPKEQKPVAPPSQVQSPATTAPREQAPSQNALDYARSVANNCLPGQWENQPCLKAVSENNLVMLSNYGATLKEAGKEAEAEVIKQKCAASTAASREEFPAYAMKSAFLECVNTIPEIANATQILPDQSQFQLLVAAIQCLDKAPTCAAIEQGLGVYKR